MPSFCPVSATIKRFFPQTNMRDYISILQSTSSLPYMFCWFKSHAGMNSYMPLQQRTAVITNFSNCTPKHKTIPKFLHIAEWGTTSAVWHTNFSWHKPKMREKLPMQGRGFMVVCTHTVVHLPEGPLHIQTCRIIPLVINHGTHACWACERTVGDPSDEGSCAHIGSPSRITPCQLLCSWHRAHHQQYVNSIHANKASLLENLQQTAQ